MAKPILIVKARKSCSIEEYSTAMEYLKKQLSEEYHIILVSSENEEYSFECLNDCKGLKDVDIEKLIEDLKNGKA